MRRLSLSVPVLAAVVVLLGQGSRILAAPANVPDRREIQARADFAAGRYQKAVDAFATLFAETADPVFLRNIGRCYQKMKRPPEAIDSFKEYLHKGQDLTAEERREIESYIKEMQDLESASRPPVPQVEPPPPQVAAPPLAPLQNEAPEVKPVVSPISPPSAAPAAIVETGGTSASDGRRWRMAGIATGIGGVALIAVGAAYGLAARSAQDQGNTQYNPDTDSAGQRDVKIQWVGYGVGVAALVTGAVLYMRGLDRAPVSGGASASVHAHVAVDLRGGTLSLQGGF